MGDFTFYSIKYMKDNYHIKFSSDNYLFGSYKPYKEEIDKYFQRYSNRDKLFIKYRIDNYIPDYRSIILEKQTRKLIGCIGIENDSDIEHDNYKVLLCCVDKLQDKDLKEIMNSYNDFCSDYLNINNMEEYFILNDGEIKSSKKSVKEETEVESFNFIDGINKELLEEYKNYYDIPNMKKSVTIKHNNKIIGIMGLSDFIFSNRRGSVNLFLDKNIDEDLSIYYGKMYLDKYIDYLHNIGIHNINYDVSGSDELYLEIAKRSNLEYYGSREYGSLEMDSLYSFQHVPGMVKKNGILIPDNKLFDGRIEKKDKTDIIPVGKRYKLVDPNVFANMNGKHLGIHDNVVPMDYYKAMNDRENFTIPLGEDKYFIEEDNLKEHLMSYDYVLLDLYNSFAGFANILRDNGSSCDIEIGISPKYQNEGIGTLMTKTYIEELFRRGYISVGANCFDFNKKSNELFNNIGDYYGTRIDSYYINGKLHNINNYNVTVDNKEKVLTK